MQCKQSDMTAQKFNVRQFISSIIAMEDVVDEGLRKLRDAGDTEVKILVNIDQ